MLWFRREQKTHHLRHPRVGGGLAARIARWMPACADMATKGRGQSFVIISLLFLSGCGFTPLHAPETTAAYPAIDIALIPDRDGHYLRNQLIDRLYAAGAVELPRYRLQISGLEKTITGFGIRKDTTSTRTQMEMQAKMRLVDTVLNVVVLERQLRAAGGFNSLSNQFATTVSEQHTADLLLKEMADAAMTEIDLFLRKDAS